MDYNAYRRKTIPVRVGNIVIGGDAPVSVQSMTNVPSSDFGALYAQMKELENAGCDIVRMTVPDMESVKVLAEIKASDVKMPVVADIHFNYRLAIEAANAGADKIRINPGNIGGEDRVKEVVRACNARNLPIRIGVNSGSVEKDMLVKYGGPTPEALAESALYHASLLEKNDFDRIVISVKSSDVRTTIGAYRLLSEKCPYPLHIGVTEAGTYNMGIVKSFVGIGSLLSDGIGDTVRVSLTDSPAREVVEGKRLLDGLGIGKSRINITSCPTCGRTRINLIDIVNDLEAHLDEMHPSREIRVAVMGCAVNGPGEAREADIGVAGGDGDALLFRHGEVIRKIPQDRIREILTEEINKL
ncbi:MAG: flavodoxin-dependent (E)-4-hydroxy-3-methylbut-2-enyl-diphosphate synthase [Firmicutes bacterium]|nr:flavodoxin-dependent (E)-4-hydroxy-3-methylbut-2-enyl-diphosphate synthase [Candidatus Colimorpha enterica]